MRKIILLLLFLCVLCSVAYANPYEISNGGFEYGNLTEYDTYESNVYSNVLIDTSVAHSGNNSALLISTPGGGATYCYMNRTLNLTNVNEITFYYRITSFPYPDINATVSINNDIVSNYSYTGDWVEENIDVSSYNGNNVLSFKSESDGTHSIGFNIDDISYTNYNPIIAYPINGTIIDSTYPETTLINFQWLESPLVDISTYQLAKDMNYLTIVSSGSTTTFTKSISLFADEYYFRVKYNYPDGTESDYVETYFNINSTIADYGTGIHGVVYRVSGGSQLPLSGARVTAFNYTDMGALAWTGDFITGENGYYLFDGLANGTYSIQASKDGYETNSINVVDVSINTTVVKDITLEEDNAPNYILPHYVQFIVRSLNEKYEGVAVTVYEGDSATTFGSLTTGSDGACGMELSETVRYRITVFKEGIIDETRYVYPTDNEYTFYVNVNNIISDILYPGDEDNEITAVDVSVTKTIINENTANITVNYTDSMDETSNLVFSLTQNIQGDADNKTVLSTVNLGTGSDVSYNFTVTNYNGQFYYVSVDADHSTFETISRLYGVEFVNTSARFGFTVEVVGWFAIIIVSLFAMTSLRTNVPQTAVLACAMCSIFVLLGWGYYISTPGLALAWVMSIAANFAKGKESGA